MAIRTDQIRFHHVGVITGSLEASITFYESLGYSASVVHADPSQKARIVLMQKEREPLVELITRDTFDMRRVVCSCGMTKLD